MKKVSYQANDVCIVGFGCVLPEANNPQEFWANLLANKNSIREAPEERWSSQFYFSEDRDEPDKTYSKVAAWVDDKQLKNIAQRLSVDFEKHTRLQIMALEATRQALEQLSPKILNRARKKVSVFLGCMEMDEALTLEKIYLYNKEQFKDYIEAGNLKNKAKILESIKKHFCPEEPAEKELVASVLTTSTISLIKEKFGFQGEGLLIDAACASSLAALDVAVKALKEGKVDLAISGGIESSLGPETFVLFSKVGALSPGQCLPFDRRSEGLSQGEGAVIFALQRLADAVRDKNKIYGVIRSVGSSSDGRSSSLFSPSVEGQVLAYSRAYYDLGKDCVDYIEGHGTGTKIGDEIEIGALNDFFGGKKIPIGSVKSLIGHTKGAAGAAGLLKCLLILQDRFIPPASYLKEPITQKEKSVYVNQRPINFKKDLSFLRLGVSSFGFGNINYHMVLDEFRGGYEAVSDKKTVADNDQIVIVGSGMASGKPASKELLASKLKIVPKSRPQTDEAQIQALLAVADAFANSNIEIDLLTKEKVSVISASTTGLASLIDLTERIRHFEFKALAFTNEKIQDYLINRKEKFPEVTEDTGSGVLNNVIAGRVCNVWDFKGKNFNIDADFGSLTAAMSVATRELKAGGGLVVLIYFEEELDKKKTKVNRNKARCILLATLAEAKNKNYPILEIIEKIDYED